MASTTLTSWALLIWKTLHQRGVDPKPLFAAANLDPAKLGDGNARYPLEGMYQLWNEVEHLGDEYLGVEIGRQWNPTTFHALGFAWLASSCLLHAMQRLERYCRLVNNSLYVTVENRGPVYHLGVSTSADPRYIHNLAIDAGTAAVLKMCRMLCGEQFSPLEIYTDRAPTAGSRRMEDLYRRPIHYHKERAYWVIDRLDAEQRLPSGNSELARINEQVADKAMARVNKDDIGGQVKQYIIGALPSGIVEEQTIADKLGMSPRSLQRKLAESGLSFSKMVAEIRESLALHYIEESHLSLNEIGYLLGFSEQASFTRAFKRWTGKSPSLYRRQRQLDAVGAA